MPSREIRSRFTKSDIAIMGWRAAETAANMRNKTLRRMPQRTTTTDDGIHFGMESVEHDEFLHGVEARLQGIVHKIVDDKGNIDLRRLTGDEAMQYMSALGIPVLKM